jgi:multidrug resistance protein
MLTIHAPGRKPMFLVTGVLFVAFQIACALTPTYAGMLVCRFLVGCMGSTFSTMVGGVVSDIYHAKDRNTAMALFAGAALFGTGFGPLVSGFLAQHTTWRWIFYLQIILDGLVVLLIVLLFKETRGSVLLSRKAKVLNQWYGELEAEGYYGMMMPTGTDSSKTAPQRIRWKVKSDEERASIGRMISISLYRPFHLLFAEPVVFFFSVWISFGWAILYLLFSAVPLIFETSHGFTIEQSGSVFAAVSIGGIISTVISIYQDRVARRFMSESRRHFLDSPEGRLYFSCIQSTLLPIGCFWS